jgi:hypothetical protein
MKNSKSKDVIYKLCSDTVVKLKAKGIDEDTATSMVVGVIQLNYKCGIEMIKLSLATLVNIA